MGALSLEKSSGRRPVGGAVAHWLITEGVGRSSTTVPAVGKHQGSASLASSAVSGTKVDSAVSSGSNTNSSSSKTQRKASPPRHRTHRKHPSSPHHTYDTTYPSAWASSR